MICKFIRYFFRKVSIKVKKIFLVKRISSEWYGNNYGGFYINNHFLDEKSIIYSFGIGEDISFDKEVIDVLNAKVYGFDPTPKSIAWIKKHGYNNFDFHQYGIGVKNEVKKFYMPQNKDHVSGSIVRNHSTGDEFINVDLKTLDQIMLELKHDYIDVLKLDIEGLEYDVIKYIVEKNIRVNQLLVEFHDRLLDDGVKKRKEVIKLLKEAKFVLFAISSSFEEFSFIKEENFISIKKRKKK